MADVPRDPRQLARDILSGKVRIEDLARERQMRGGAGAPIRPVPPPAPPQARPAPARPQARPMPVRPPPVVRQPPPRPVQRGPVQGGGRRPVITVPPKRMEPVQPARQERSAVDVPSAQVHAYDRPKEMLEAPKAVVPRRKITPRDLAHSRTALRQSIIMAEVLGKPVGLR